MKLYIVSRDKTDFDEVIAMAVIAETEECARREAYDSACNHGGGQEPASEWLSASVEEIPMDKSGVFMSDNTFV